MTLRRMLLLGAAALAPSLANAQTCLGLPSFAGPIHVTGTAQFGDGFSFYAGGIGAGKQGGPFASVGGGGVMYDGPGGNSSLGFIEGGFELLSRGRVRACPVAGFSYEKLPDDADLTSSVRTGTIGLALGAPLTATPGLQLVPNASVRYVRSSLKVDDAISGTDTDTESSGLLDLGLALLLNDWFSIQPTFQVPFGTDYSETSFGIFVGISFGKRR